MKSADEWYVEILAEIIRLKSREKKYCYYPNVDMTDSIAGELKRLLSNPDFNYTEVTFRKCAQCLNKYDITIGW